MRARRRGYDHTMSATHPGVRRFPIRFSKPNRSLALIGVTPQNSYVEVGPDDVVVALGWGFHLRVPRSSIVSAEVDTDRVLGWGAHGWRGEWLVNGSSQGIVRLRIDPHGRGRVTGFPVRVHTLRVSVTDPTGLIATLGGDSPAGAGPAE